MEALDALMTRCSIGGLIEPAPDEASLQRALEAALRAPDEILWGLGLGCGGKVTLLLELLPADGDAASPLAAFEQLEQERTPREVVTRFAGEVVLRERIHPAIRLVLAGAGRDAVPLARLAGELGWETIIFDTLRDAGRPRPPRRASPAWRASQPSRRASSRPKSPSIPGRPPSC